MIQFVLDASLAVTHLLELVALRMANDELQALGCVPGLPFATTPPNATLSPSFTCRIMATIGHEQEAHTVDGGVPGPEIKMKPAC